MQLINFWHRQIHKQFREWSHNVYSTTSADYGIKYLLNDPDNYDFTPKSTSTQLIDSGTIIEELMMGFWECTRYWSQKSGIHGLQELLGHQIFTHGHFVFKF